MKLKQLLENKIPKRELDLIPSSFDVVGDIAIFNDLPKELKKREKMIAATLMSLHKNIKVVAKKTGQYQGKMRTAKITLLGGEKRKETVHKENGCSLKVDVEKCYFSPRLSTERLRIAQLTKKDESILVLFSGVAVYLCVIAKNAEPKEIYGIEINKIAHKYALENIKINKLKNIKLYAGDAKKILPAIKKRFDRIIMPLPQSAEQYLDDALKKLKPRGTVHLYLFSREENIESLKREYQKYFSSVKMNICGHYSPGVYRICLDIKK